MAKRNAVEFAMIIHDEKLESNSNYMICSWERDTGAFICREIIPGSGSVIVGSHKGACKSRYDFKGIIGFYANYWNDHIVYLK